jgi:hypothetical protein
MQLEERTAGVLIPYMFIIWQYSVDQEKSEGVDIKYGIDVDGEWGGKWLISVKDGQMSYEGVEDLSDAEAVFHFDNPSDMVLTTYQRFEGGEESGDPEVIEAARTIYFPI